MSLRKRVTSLWAHIQENLFPYLEEEVGPLTESHQKLVIVLDVACVEAFAKTFYGLPGRPAVERAPMARAFVAKAVLNLPTTVALIDRLHGDKTLRRLCGWESVKAIPQEWTFSRAFAEFAKSDLPGRVHEALIRDVFENRLVGHVSRDSTAIEGREKPHKSAQAPVEKPKRKRGRPRKGEERPTPAEPRRIEKQAAGMSLAEMLTDLPNQCDVGAKRNSKGKQEIWIGYKLHIDTVDGDIPVSCVLTSASVHDSQVALPLAAITAARGVVNCYDIMDSAYDVPEIRSNSRNLGHVPIIDINPRRNTALKEELAQEAKRLKVLGHTTAEQVRYNERSSAERVNSQVKDSYGGKTVRVRGPEKVYCHLMFGVLAITALQIMRLAI